LSVVRAEGLVVAHGRQRVLDLHRLDLAQGQTLALLGPNGAGKSTLLRVLALLERPGAGRLELFGSTIPGRERDRLALRRRLAMVFQDPLLTDRTVYDNVALGLRLRRYAGGEIRRRVTRWLERFGIGALAARHPRTLSGGEARRVSLARAFVLEPELLLLDEPFASLDVHGREALALELELILREARLTTILVTHDRTESLLLADRALVLLRGSARQEGQVRDVFSAPADAEVAGFLGVENLLAATVEPAGDEGLALRLGGRAFSLPPRLVPAGPVLLALRAEDVHFVAPGSGDEPGRLRLPARVTRVVPYGVPYRVELDAGVPIVGLAARHTVDRFQLTPGREVLVSFDVTAVHLVRR